MSRGPEQTSRLASAVRAARHRRGWSRETLAHASGLSWSAVTQIETGRRRDVRASSLEALADALEVSLDYLVRGGVGPEMLDHRALMFCSPEELGALAAPIVDDDLESGQAVLVVATPPHVAAIKKELGPASKHVHFGDAADWYRSPLHVAAKFEGFARGALAEGAHWVDVLGEPIWAGRSRADVTSWTRYEAMLNAMFAPWPASVSCLYDAPTLPARVAADIDRTHPEVLSADGTRDSASYEPPIQYLTS